MTKTSRPTHRVYAVTKNGDRSYWREIGAAWSHTDGEGFNLKLDYLPLNNAEIVIRKPRTDERSFSRLIHSEPLRFAGRLPFPSDMENSNDFID